MPLITYTDKAIADLARLYDFLYDNSPLSARKASVVIAEKISLLHEQPALGKPTDEGSRELGIVFGNSGYLVLYRIEAKNVVITAIKHYKEENFD